MVAVLAMSCAAPRENADQGPQPPRHVAAVENAAAAGIVTHLMGRSSIGGIHLGGRTSSETIGALVSFDEGTRVWVVTGGAFRAGEPSEVAKGDRVSVWSPISTLSAPPQMVATDVLIHR